MCIVKYEMVQIIKKTFNWVIEVCTFLYESSLYAFRANFGDTDIPFCIQSCSKPLNYALAVSLHGSREVHKYVGQEPSGRTFNDLTLDHNSA